MSTLLIFSQETYKTKYNPYTGKLDWVRSDIGGGGTSNIGWVSDTANDVTYTDPSGHNVGIGTTSPAYPLDVVGNAKFSGGNLYGSTNRMIWDLGTSIQFGGDHSSGAYFGNYLDTRWYVRPSGYANFRANGNYMARIDENGLRIENSGSTSSTSATELLDVTYSPGIFLRSFRGTTDTDITGWITTNANGDTCYCYPDAAGTGIIVSTTKP